MRVATLRQYVKRVGGQEKAAARIGVSFKTVNRWLNGYEEPSGLAVYRLKELGVKVR